MVGIIKLISPTFVDIFEPNIEIGQFPDGDSHVRIPQISEVSGQDVVIFHRLYPKQNNGIVVLLLILDAVKLENPKSITLVVPYLPYSRQDKKKLNGEVQSAYALCNLLRRAGCDKLITFDCHFLNAEGQAEFGGLKIENISMGAELVKRAKQHFGNEDFEVVAPDAGATYLVKSQGGKAFKKVRQEYKDEKIGYREIESLECNFEVKDKNFLVLDDMISTGNTMIRALEILKLAGAKTVCAASTHGLFLFNCADRLKKFTNCIISTDSIENEFAMVSIKDRLIDL